jgi:hypothetical protein
MDGMMKLFFSLCLAIALLAKIAAAQAAVMYQCVDEDNRKTFSNVKLSDKGIKCTAMDLGPMTTIPPAQVTKPARSATSPAGFPKVGEDAQKERDSDRRRILENELEAERGNLEQARKDLSEQESNIRNGGERNTQGLRDGLESHRNKAALHERNIEAIEKELTKLR